MSSIRTVLALIALAVPCYEQANEISLMGGGSRRMTSMSVREGTPAASGPIVSVPFNPDDWGSYSNYPASGPSQQTAVAFQITQAATIDAISWFGRYELALPLSSPVAFVVAFFVDQGGQPAQVPVARFDLGAGVQNAASTFQGVPWCSYSASLSLALTPGSYWLSVMENDTRSGQWLWAFGKYDTGREAYRANSEPWTLGNPVNHAFTLTGTTSGAVPGPLAVTSTSPLPPGTVGALYSQQLNASGGAAPYTWRVTAGALPPGLSLGAGGVASGTPTTIGAYNFTVEVRDSTAGAASKDFQLTVNAQSSSGPSIAAGGIVNAATNTAGPVAAGSLVSIYGANFWDASMKADSIPLPTTLGKVKVTFNSVPAPLVFVAPGQINAQVPWDVLPAGTQAGTAVVVVTRDGVASAPATVQLGPFSPGIFAVNYGVGNAIAINPDGSLAAATGSIPEIAARPAKAGDPGGLVILATGLGALDSPQPNGTNSLDRVRKTLILPEVLIGGMAGTVTFSGASPQFVGVNQVNITIPGGAPRGDNVPLQFRIGGITTTDRVTVALSRPVDPLTVSPSDSLQVSGQSGQLNPGSYKIAYTVQNTTATMVSYTLASSANWVTVSKSTGTVGAGGQDSFTVSLNSNANLLDAGSYTATVTLADRTYGSVVTRSVALTLAAGPCLNVAGQWVASERGSLTCTVTVNGDSETDTDSISGGDMITISQQSCQVAYTSSSIMAAFGSGRTVRQGEVSGSNVRFAGIMGELAPGFNYEKNYFEASGPVHNSTISLTGSGTLIGSGVWQGMNASFSCTVTSSATLTKFQ